MKRLPVAEAYRTLYPRLTVVVSVEGEDRPNFMTAAWSTPLSKDPPLVGVSVAPKRYTHGLVEEARSFGVNVIGENLLDEAFLFGSESGRDVDKAAETGAEVVEGEELSVPLLAEAAAAMECSLEETVTTGDHDLFVGRVEGLYVAEDAMDRGWMRPDTPIYWRDSSFRDVFQFR